uniref:peptidylprolyl isomerase n=1 Tax=Solanum lycopersicum TaxID=4081 RepID=A0A3Q7JV89_SOLLC
MYIIFSHFGTVTYAEIIRYHKTRDSHCYAFIEFEDKESCDQAYFMMDNTKIYDRRIRVDFSLSVAKLWPNIDIETTKAVSISIMVLLMLLNSKKKKISNMAEMEIETSLISSIPNAGNREASAMAAAVRAVGGYFVLDDSFARERVSSIASRICAAQLSHRAL